jgi:hypothetical protein
LSGHRYSIATFCPSTNPRSLRPRRKAATRIIKAEVVQHPGRAPNNPRFVVTNLRDAPEAVYQLSPDRLGAQHRNELAYAQVTNDHYGLTARIVLKCPPSTIP